MENAIIQNNDIVCFEGMTTISALISSIENKKNSRRIIKILFDKDKTSSKRRELSFLKIKSKALGYEIALVNSEELKCYSTSDTHGGVVALCTARNIPSLSYENINTNGVYYIFEGIEDPYNFGYMIRSVYAAGADGVILSERNWLSAASTVSKSSAGTSELIDLYVCDLAEAVDMLKKRGFCVVCAGIRDSESIYDAQLQKPLLVVIGGEKRGISRKILDKADKIVRIDYGREFKGSLPSVAATSIISFEILKKTR